MLRFTQPDRSFKIGNGNSVGDYGYTHVKGKTPIEWVDLDLPTPEQAAKFRADFGFIPMSWFRLHCSGETAVRELVDIGRV